MPIEYREIKVLELASASATRLGPMIQQLMDARLDRLRKVQPETAELERVVVLPDTRANALVIAAGEESFEVIKRLVEDLDLGSIGDEAEIHIVPVPKGGLDPDCRDDREGDGSALRRFADARLLAGNRPLVMTDPRTSSLLVAAMHLRTCAPSRCS